MDRIKKNTKCKKCVFWKKAKRIFFWKNYGICNFKYGHISLNSWPQTSGNDSCPEGITKAEIIKFGICPADYLLRETPYSVERIQ